jgi:hypothetical protein
MKKYILYILLSLPYITLFAQEDPNKLAELYKKKIEAATTTDEKIRLAKELQDKLLPKEYQTGQMSAKQLLSLNDQLYKATFSFSGETISQQSCGSKCGYPCEMSSNSTIKTTLTGSLQATMSYNYGMYVMSGSGENLKNISANGSNNNNSTGKGCSGSRTCSTQGNVNLANRIKEASFNFTYNTNDGTWNMNINMPSVSHTKCVGNDPGENADAESILFAFSNSDKDITIQNNQGKITLVGHWTTKEIDAPRNDETTNSYNMSLALTPVTVGKYEAIITPSGKITKDSFEHWLPTGPAMDGSTDKGNLLSFKVVVRDKKDTTKLYTKPYKIRFELTASNYPGYCSNFPAYTLAPDVQPDLRFDSLSKVSGRFTSVTDDVAETDLYGMGAEIYIRSYDYGAHGSLSATITLGEDATSFDAHPYYDKDGLSIGIPYDQNHNHMADAWERDEGILQKNVPTDWDEDLKPVNGNMGDDIYIIDEYRGFYVEVDKEKKYTRFKANVKELVTFSRGDFRKEAGQGTLQFGKVAQVKTYTMNAFSDMNYVATNASMNSLYPKWLNYNSPTRHLTSLVVVWPTYRPELKTNTDLTQKYKPHVLASYKHEADASTNNLPGVPDGTGAYYPADVDYIILRLDYTAGGFLEHKNWFHPACDSVGQCFPGDVKHALHANQLYQAGIDTNILSTTLQNSIPSLMSRFVVFETVHELGHATNIHHHNVSDPDAEHSLAYYKNDINCPMRYWCTTGLCQNNYDWMIMFWAHKWDPGSMVTPSGTNMQFCTKQDDCKHQMDLKKR